MQKEINVSAALGVKGDVATPNQAVYFPLNLAAKEAVDFGNFVWRDGDKVTNVQGTVEPLGIAQRNYMYSDDDQTKIPQDAAVMTVVRGDMYVLTTTAAKVGDNVFAMANGAIGCATAATLAGGVATGWKVATAGEINDTIIITK